MVRKALSRRLDDRILNDIIHDMKTTSPPLLPILRSGAQARLLTTLFLEPDLEFTVSDLAARAGTSIPTATREVARAEKAGIVMSRRVGRSKLVRANLKSDLYEDLSNLLLRTFGPVAVLEKEFSGIQGVEHLYIFGSWAARFAGQPGPPPRDIDVMIVGEPNRDEVYDAAERAESLLSHPVQTTIRTTAQWQALNDDPFIVEVKSRPLLEVGAERKSRPE